MIGQTKVSVDAKGELVLPFPNLNGKPSHWVETAPFVWRDRGSHYRLAAKVVDGKAVRFSFDELSPFMVFERPPWYQNAAWLLPLLVRASAALLLTALLWPVTAIVRRRYGAKLILEGQPLRAYRWSKIAAILILAALGIWATVIALMFKDLNKLGAKFDSVVHFAQLFGIVAFIGGFAADAVESADGVERNAPLARKGLEHRARARGPSSCCGWPSPSS